jgi:hypothetical protein
MNNLGFVAPFVGVGKRYLSGELLTYFFHFPFPDLSPFLNAPS